MKRKYLKTATFEGNIVRNTNTSALYISSCDNNTKNKRLNGANVDHLEPMVERKTYTVSYDPYEQKASELTLLQVDEEERAYATTGIDVEGLDYVADVDVDGDGDGEVQHTDAVEAEYLRFYYYYYYFAPLQLGSLGGGP